MDKSRSSSYPNRSSAERVWRFASARCVSLLGVVGLTALSVLAPGCHEFDTERTPPPRGSVGQEMFGVICDRVSAQALREDLSGASFRAVCHKPFSGGYADTVDTSKLPPVATGLVDENDQPVSVEKQRKDRAKAIGRIEALARRRGDLIRAFDATFPEDEKIAIKDLDNADPTKSCGAPKKSGEGLLVDALADMLGRMGELYNDGTLPHSTQSLARVVAAFEKDEDAQLAWQRISARQGYRPIETALGAARPVVAYPGLRDFSNASLRLLSADSQPYEPNPRRDADGDRIPVAGPGNHALNKMLEVGHEELLAAEADETKPSPLTVRTDASGRVVISRPRDNLEMMQELLYTEDEAFVSGSSRYIVRRDSRGYAMIRGGAVPAPFVDADGDGLPDLDAVGRFKTSNGSVAPSPFSFPGAPDAARDRFDRATAGDGLLYEYIDTSRTFAAQMMKDMKPLVNSDPEAKHETLMDMMGGLPVVMGPRETRSKKYANKTIQFDGVRTKDSPMLDLVYALGAILGDKSADATLAMTKELFTTNARQTARVTGAMSAAFDIAAEHPEASIPRESTFWDENLDVMAKVAKEPGLLEDILKALAAPESAQLGTIFSKFASFKDEITYDENDINGTTYNITTKSKGEMKTPVDRSAPYTGKNRSALYRFLGLISDTMGVTACNKADAKVHALGLSVPGTFAECAVFKIENLGAFYLDAIANAGQYEPDAEIPRGTIYMRPAILRAPGTVTAMAGIIEDSSGLVGMWPAAGQIVAPTPKFLNRLVFFDLKNDTKNAKTKLFVGDLQGDRIGTSPCPERVIDDPSPDAKDARADGKVRGLRNCPSGQWLGEKGKNTLFTWEQFGFYDAIRPLLGAFVKHRREDLFLELSSIIYRHYPGKEATPEECRLADGKQCTREGMSSYEGLVAEAFAGDVIPALSALAKELENMAVKTCTATDASGACTAAGTRTVSGIEVAAQATRAALDPDYARSIKLTDRNGKTTTTRNDGTTVPQVTPAYLLTNALFSIDVAFDKYEEQNPNDKERRAGWRRARSQLVDQFLGTTGIRSNSAFANPSIPKMTPVIVDMLRAQLWAHCPRSFVAPYEKCTWAREELAAKAEETLAGPLVTAGVDVMDALRGDPEGRRETEKLLEYLLDAASKNDALASLLASANDMVQLLRDEKNLVPLYKVLAQAVDGSKYDDKGKLTEKSLVDAQMALLARLSGKYFDAEGNQVCSREIDPNQVLASVLGKVVTPIKDGDFKGQAPLEVIIDVIADVNREDPDEEYDGTLRQKDYAAVSKNVVDFLIDPESGLEQFYEVIRQGTKR
ncbi:MAG: hypothetical protein KF850_18565 [Labilithrix sp.]|nr:hypothetical protein [Labilithrix sp.]